MKNQKLTVSQTSVAQALAADYFCIYYVDTDNGEFIEFSSSPEYQKLGLPRESSDFSRFSRENFEHVVYPEDRERFLEEFTKEHVMSVLAANHIYTLTFRMVFDQNPVYVHLKVTPMIEEKGNHVVIGISNIDEQMKALEAYEAAHHASVTYNRVAQALAKDYFSIYVVNPDTDRFAEYSSAAEYESLGIEKTGEDFFNLSRKNMERVIYPEDRDRFMGTFTKEKLMSILERDGSFTMKYRLMFGENPVYISMKATLLDDKDGRYVIIGTNNIDAQMKRETEYRQRMAEARISARNDFLANMSHDIRTPMNAIVGYTNIAKSHRDDKEAVMNALDKISSSSHFLLSLINDILDISKIESGKMQISEAPCDLEELFHRIEDITALQARNKSLHIRYQHDHIQHYKVIADELRIEQILINIVSNAIKYTPEGQEVELIAEELTVPGSKRQKYRFVIRDTGIGISEEYLPYIFESFTREQNTKFNRVQGTGLGLAITAEVVEMMNGTIQVRSKVGEGSEFTVELDLEILEELPEAEDAEETMDLKGLRILLVEDNEINAEIATMTLEQYEMQVEGARNGQIGLEKMKGSAEGYYDAVLMDIQMPVMNGYEAARAIRAMEGTYYQNLPIIAMSANAYDEDVRDCLEAGMNAHIAKPFDPGKLIQTLSRFVKKNRTL